MKYFPISGISHGLASSLKPNNKLNFDSDEKSTSEECKFLPFELCYALTTTEGVIYTIPSFQTVLKCSF